MSRLSVDLVVPTLGRPSLRALLEGLRAGEIPDQIILVDDRPAPRTPITGLPHHLSGRVRVLAGGGRGPAAARNLGWRSSTADWVAFLDDDVVPEPGWFESLLGDLEPLGDGVAGSQGRVRVPVPAGRPATDWERNVKNLEGALWITADMAYRRKVLQAMDGFDERFPRAFREDSELALRVLAAGWRLVGGTRSVVHPVRPAGFWVSVGLQAGNADDALLRALHGAGWKEAVGETRGRQGRHVAVVAAALLAATGWAAHQPRLGLLGLAGWTLGTAQFAWSRIRPGPRGRREVVSMIVTSVLIPPWALYHRLRGMARAARLLAASTARN